MSLRGVRGKRIGFTGRRRRFVSRIRAAGEAPSRGFEAGCATVGRKLPENTGPIQRLELRPRVIVVLGDGRVGWLQSTFPYQRRFERDEHGTSGRRVKTVLINIFPKR
jgi:hypothetical protein